MRFRSSRSSSVSSRPQSFGARGCEPRLRADTSTIPGLAAAGPGQCERHRVAQTEATTAEAEAEARSTADAKASDQVDKPYRGRAPLTIGTPRPGCSGRGDNGRCGGYDNGPSRLPTPIMALPALS